MAAFPGGNQNDHVADVVAESKLRLLRITLVRLADLADDEYTIKRVCHKDGKIVLRSMSLSCRPMLHSKCAHARSKRRNASSPTR